MNIDHSNNIPVNKEFIPGNLYRSPGGDLFLCSRNTHSLINMLINARNGSTLVTLNYERYIDVTDLYTLRRNK